MTTPPNPPPPENPYGNQPENPYGAPPPFPPAGSPPPAYGAPPPPPAYGTPPPPAYGATPPYGSPPMYGGGAPPAAGASKGMAIWALVLSFLICLPILAQVVSIVLALIVLRRGKDGRDHGRGLAIGALAVSALVIVGTLAITAILVLVGTTLTPVGDLRTGDCFNASGVSGDGEEVGVITTVDCDEPHDAEVVVTRELSAAEASSYSTTGRESLCTEAIEEAGAVALVDQPGLEFFGLTQVAEPDEGDLLACIAHRQDGERLTAPLEDGVS